MNEQNCLQTDLTMNRTIPFNTETSMRIRSRKKSEFRSPARTRTFVCGPRMRASQGGSDERIRARARAPAAAEPLDASGRVVALAARVARAAL